MSVGPNVEFFAWDTEGAVPGAVSSVIVAADQAIPPRSLRQVADAIIASHPEALDVEQVQFEIGGAEAIRVTYRIQLTAVTVTQVRYILSLRGSTWSIVFTTPSEEYEARGVQFDESASLFRVLEGPTISDYLRDNSQCFVTLAGASLIVVGALASRLRRKRHANPS